MAVVSVWESLPDSRHAFLHPPPFYVESLWSGDNCAQAVCLLSFVLAASERQNPPTNAVRASALISLLCPKTRSDIQSILFTIQSVSSVCDTPANMIKGLPGCHQVTIITAFDISHNFYLLFIPFRCRWTGIALMNRVFLTRGLNSEGLGSMCTKDRSSSK